MISKVSSRKHKSISADERKDGEPKRKKRNERVWESFIGAIYRWKLGGTRISLFENQQCQLVNE